MLSAGLCFKMCLLNCSGIKDVISPEDLESLAVDKLPFFLKPTCASGKVYTHILLWLLNYFIHTIQVKQQTLFKAFK